MKYYNILLKIFVFVFLILVCFESVNAEVKWKYIRSPKYKTELKAEYNKIPEEARNLYDDVDLKINIYGYNYYPNYVGLFNGV